MQKLKIYNTLSRRKEEFEPLHPPFVGLYVCGPTVYGEAHLGHARPAITFDILFRYLSHIGYKVRYVRNITDVGHLENDADTGEDKIAKKARLEKLEPMEIVQLYTNNYHDCMRQLNVLPPSIEPRATGHIIEQQQMIQNILQSGFAYEAGGSVYFDVQKYNEKHNYGKLSGRKIDELFSNTRELEGQAEKRSSLDFAIWKKADDMHIMQWPSPWSYGFPGWHLECSAMSTKYLGEQFDIHGGGMDLMFPHHECEIAQSVAVHGKEPARYWMHNNMITINDQKMSKSLGNFITLQQLFTGNHSLLSQAYSPMTIRFFILQAQYRSTLDFSNEALQAAEKGFDRMCKAYETLQKLSASDSCTCDVKSIKQQCYEAMNDDLNSPVVISYLFDLVRIVNSVDDGKEKIDAKGIEECKDIFKLFMIDLLGLMPESKSANPDRLTEELVELLLSLRLEARKKKDFVLSDTIRDHLARMGIIVKDSKDGSGWEIK